MGIAFDDPCEGLDPEYVHELREIEIGTVEANCPEGERRMLDAEGIAELQDWAKRRQSNNGTAKQL